MSEQPTVLGEDAPRAAVIRRLRMWSARRSPGWGDRPEGRREAAALAAVEEGGPGCWAGLCEMLHASGLHLDMLATAPGLWSHCRLAAGPSWHGVATMTRGLIRHLGTSPGGVVTQAAGRDAHGVGCVMIDGDRLWLADHLLYACQDDLEIALDCRFYGCARDPDLHGISEHRHQWSYLQRRWFTAMAGPGSGPLPEAGWISSPRWLFPLPAHALPRSALGSELGQRLWSAALTAADGCASCVSPRPSPWWCDGMLVPGPQWAGAWAQRERLCGHGVQSPDALAARSPDDPCVVPMILAALAPVAERAADRMWALIAALVRVLHRQLAQLPPCVPAVPSCIDIALPCGGHRLMVEQDGGWRAANGWALSRALGLAGLMPTVHHLQGPGDWPPATLLRSGLAAVMADHAAPALRPGKEGRQAVNILDLGKLSWSWSDPGTPCVPPGWAPLEDGQLAQALMRPGAVEIEGVSSYDAVTGG